MQLTSRQSGLLPWRGGIAPVGAQHARGTDAHRNAEQTLAAEPLAANQGFIGQLDWMLSRLRTAHVRITFVRIELRMGGSGETRAARRIAEELDDAYGLAGMLADGSVMAAFFGPRQPGGSGDRQQSKAILDRLEQVLRDVVGDRAAAGATVFLIHRWTDEIADMPTLMLQEMSGPRAVATRLELVPA